MNMQHSAPISRVRLGIVIAGGALAVGMALSTAGSAQAIPESTIKAECKDANGEYYTQVNPQGQRVSSCCYKDIKGVKHCDMYIDGVYQVVSAPPPDTTRPFQPPEQVDPGSISQN